MQQPKSQVVAAGQDGVSFNCTVKGEDFEWTINGELNSVERNEKLINSGVEFLKGQKVNGVCNHGIVIPATQKFNATRIKCITLNVSDTLESLEANMIIAGMIPLWHCMYV